MDAMSDLNSWYSEPLPKPPVPTLEHTFARYLEYAKVLATSPDEFKATERNVIDFLKNGRDIQTKLEKLAEKEPNWVNYFWLPEMYLKARYSLVLYSNPAYIFPQQEFASDDDYLTYTAYLIRGMVEFRESIIRKETSRDYVTRDKSIPMCMDQYDRLFSSYRKAQSGEDIILKTAPNVDEHIIVMCRRQAYAVAVKIAGELVPHSIILYQLQHIMEMAQNRNGYVAMPVAGATAGERDRAADFWTAALLDPMNRDSFNAISSAVFGVCLDIEKCDKNVNASTQGQFILHGYGSEYSGLNRWFDHTIQLVVARDGTNGLCIEHSVAEGIVIIKMAEHAIRYERAQKARNLNIAPEVKIKPKPMKWRVTQTMQQILNENIGTLDRLANDLELKRIVFNDFGKEKIKSLKVSPDGFLQLCMQLAHYRLHGKLVSTYESASIRRFALGRVDNIRSATPEALSWVVKVDDPELTLEEKQAAFRVAASKQAEITRENVTGYGIDNHLCALSTLATKAVQKKELAKQFEVFSDPLWNRTMQFPLSTSQVSTSLDMKGSYLCYGPVVDNGYGNAYNIQPHEIILAVSAKKSYPHTDAAKFGEALCQAMRDAKNLIEQQ